MSCLKNVGIATTFGNDSHIRISGDDGGDAFAQNPIFFNEQYANPFHGYPESFVNSDDCRVSQQYGKGSVETLK